MSHELDMIRKNVAIAKRVLLAQRSAAVEERRPDQEQDRDEREQPNPPPQPDQNEQFVSDA